MDGGGGGEGGGSKRIQIPDRAPLHQFCPDRNSEISETKEQAASKHSDESFSSLGYS